MEHTDKLQGVRPVSSGTRKLSRAQDGSYHRHILRGLIAQLDVSVAPAAAETVRLKFYRSAGRRLPAHHGGPELRKIALPMRERQFRAISCRELMSCFTRLFPASGPATISLIFLAEDFGLVSFLQFSASCLYLCLNAQP